MTVIFVHFSIDKKTFGRLAKIGRAFDVRLVQKIQSEDFELSENDKKSFEALNRLDGMRSIYKGLKRLSECQTV